MTDSRDAVTAGRGTYRGEVAYLYAFDLAWDMKREPLGKLLGQPVRPFAPGPTRHRPREMMFFRPQMASLEPVERTGPGGKVTVSRTVKLFPVGALSIRARVPFEVNDLRELRAYHDLSFDDGSLADETRELAETILEEVRALCVRPQEKLPRAEAYTVFCLDNASVGSSADGGTDAWMKTHRRDVAALLVEDSRPEKLSTQKTEETTAPQLSYYDDDLIIADWDAALVVERPRNFDEILHVMELTNVQLAELRAYDVALDRRLELSYRHLGGRRRPRRDLPGQLREIRIDLARLSDELQNITKFFGDWHLARLYQQLSTRFHLSDWTQTINQKLRTLDEIYTLLKQDQNNRWMLILEATIVLLFIIDVIIIVWMGSATP
ncbi:MAG TPA: hypothetical protein VMY39_06790 [Planctomycetota bacterium]|nr:hypothetical protein [Planctomycetota bacterium]